MSKLLTVFVGSRETPLLVTAGEAKKHGLKNGITIKRGVADLIARERLMGAQIAADLVLARFQQRDSASRPDRRVSGGGGYIRRG